MIPRPVLGPIRLSGTGAGPVAAIAERGLRGLRHVVLISRQHVAIRTAKGGDELFAVSNEGCPILRPFQAPWRDKFPFLLLPQAQRFQFILGKGELWHPMRPIESARL